ncbi:MAG TPA: nuclear transport factor 2 family protein [Agriterribacter sp.]|nr:nuclear transport factor 2 family protein [Agriterribacter sp.]HRQ49964.1 nuclear transport factor 2 family protein [Agriterribacter sp.]
MPATIHEQRALSLKNACVEFMFAYQQKNVNKMLNLCDPEGTVDFKPLGSAGKGKIYELGKNIWSALIDCFPDIDNTLDAAVAEDDNSVRCQVVIRGTQEKDFGDIPNRGLHFDSDHIFIFRLNPDNKITAIRISWDHEDLKRQLGS